MKLVVEDLTVSYGNLPAVRGICLEVGEGEIVSLVGPNAAGKSSTVRAISGQITGFTGRVKFGNHDLAGLGTEAIVRHRLATVPEDRGILTTLTVHENLLLPATVGYGRQGRRTAIDDVADRFPAIAKHRHSLAGALSGGEQQQVAIARALLLRPELIILDEPSLGLAPTLVDAVFELIQELNNDGVAVLLVEQEAHRAVGISDRAYVMVQGLMRDEGPREHFTTGYDFALAYLGRDDPKNQVRLEDGIS
jgi:branched-chain amino acid transport system ATP-binding protein